MHLTLNRAVAALTVCLGAGAVFWLASRRPDLGQQVLPDGTTLTLLAIKAGEKHPSPYASLAERIATKLPATWNARLKIRPAATTSSEYSSSNYLSVWFRVENRQRPPRYRLLIGDEQDNFTINAEHHGRSVSTQLSSNVWLLGLPVAAWPRRAEQLRIRVYHEHQPELVAEFEGRNPGRDLRTPAWTAPEWPITMADGDLQFTLVSLWIGLRYPREWRLREQKDPIQRGTRATFRVTRHGQVLTNWNAHHVRAIRDATGNWSDGNGFNSTIRDGQTMNQFSRPPLPADEAWRITVEFSRVSGFKADELHTITNFVVPRPGRSSPSVTNFLGTASLISYWDSLPGDKEDSTGIRLEVVPTRRDHKITLVSAMDDRGRAVPFENSGGGQSVTHERLFLGPDAKVVDLVVAFHSSRVVTFQAKPDFYGQARTMR